MNCETKRSIKYLNPNGYLVVIYGPMFSSKTDYLLMLLSVRMGISQKILIINSILDIRPGIKSSGILTSHRDSPSKVKTATEVYAKDLSEISQKLIYEHEVIGIDEAQFFSDITLVYEWIKLGKTVITAGLIFTSECKPFGKYIELLSHADEVIPLTAVCIKCREEKGIILPAKMTKCLKIKDTDVMIGSDEYIPVCRKCYYS